MKTRKGADEVIAVSIVAGKTLHETAAAAGVCEATVKRRLRDPQFAARLDQMRRQVVQEALDRLAASLTRASETMAALLDARAENVRLNAAKAIWEQVWRARQVRLEEDVEELKRILAEMLLHHEGKGGGGGGGGGGEEQEQPPEEEEEDTDTEEEDEEDEEDAPEGTAP